jgi:nucleoid-associated protein YgaU
MSVQVVTVAGGNLFALAAKYLNDATQWIRIAQANNLRDPVLAGVVTLTIPAVNAAAGGGIAS